MKTNHQLSTYPLISVVMPMYNAGRFVHTAIQSIQKQIYPNWELIVLDDHSSDNSYERVKVISQQDKRIKLYRKTKNIGIGACMNFLIKHAKGKYIARMDADDIAHPKRLKTQVRYLMNHPDIGIVGSYMVEVNRKGKITAYRTVPLDHYTISKQMILTQTIQNPSLMINRRLIPVDKLYYSTKLTPVDDLDFLFRQLQYTRYANIPLFLMKYRKHDTNSSLRDIKRTFRLTWQVRIHAIVHYGYRAGWNEIALNILQRMAVEILPNQLIYPMFKLWRGEGLRVLRIRIKRISILNARLFSDIKKLTFRVAFG